MNLSGLGNANPAHASTRSWWSARREVRHRLQVRALVIPKSDLKEPEDRIASSRKGVRRELSYPGGQLPPGWVWMAREFSNVEWARFAMADGATEYSWSDLWASQIAETFVRQSSPISPLPLSIKIRKRALAWWRDTAGLVDWRNPYAVRKREMGSGSTFLGIDFNLRSGAWHAFARGNTDLFFPANTVDRESTLPWPAKDTSRDFGQFTSLIMNRPEMLSTVEFVEQSGFLSRPNQSLVMATDAVSKYLVLAGKEVGGPVSFATKVLADPPLLESLRTEGTIGPDDLSIALLEWTEGGG